MFWKLQRLKKTITVEFIQQINALVMKNTGSVYNTVFGEIDATKGMFRKGNVSAGGSYFPNYDKVIPYTTSLVKRLDENLARVQRDEEQLKLSFSAHFDLVSIHPFYDGNGRTNRLLMNYIEAYHGLPLAIVFKEDKADYYVALKKRGKQEDMQIFYAFMFGQYRKQLEQEIVSFTEAMSQKTEPKREKGLDIRYFLTYLMENYGIVLFILAVMVGLSAIADKLRTPYPDPFDRRRHRHRLYPRSSQYRARSGNRLSDLSATAAV